MEDVNEGKIIYDVSQAERNWAVLSHLCGFILIIPFANIVGPLIIWKLHQESKFVEKSAVAALNFQITLTIATAICALLTAVFIGFILMPIVAIGGMIFSVIAALRTAEKEAYTYKYTYEFIKIEQ